MGFIELTQEELKKLTPRQLSDYATKMLLNAGYSKKEVSLTKVDKNVISKDPKYFEKLNSKHPHGDDDHVFVAAGIDENIADYGGRLPRCAARFDRIERESGRDAACCDEK